VLRQVLLSASRGDRIRHLILAAPAGRRVVRRYVAGVGVDDAVSVAAELAGGGAAVTLDHLGEDTTDLARARAVRDAYVVLLRALAQAGLTAGGRAEVSVKLSAIGQALGRDGHQIALEHTYEICAAAARANTTVTLDMEDHTTTDSTLEILREVRGEYPWLGGVLQAYLRRTEADCRDLAGPGSRIRLCKGAYAEPETVAYRTADEVDRSYARCLKILMAGGGYPMAATHDPRLVDLAIALAVRARRPPGAYEIQMLYGVRPAEQRRLVLAGERVRVYVPYGSEWYGYLMRRMAERPANAAFFLRSLLTKG
jgi:proline dehydrogenase